MDGPVMLGERVSWPMGVGECAGTVQGIENHGGRQLLSVLADDGSRHALLVAPGSRGGTELVEILTNRAQAVALARSILAGQECRVPPTRQVLTLAAALAAPESLPEPEETKSDERAG